jgi:GGDEF domain-containing protein
MMLVLEGDWDASRESLAALQILGYALSAVRARDALAGSRRLLVRVYRAVRQLAPAQGADVVAGQLVKATAHLLGASKVSLALDEPSKNRVTLAATLGLPDGLQSEPIPRGHGVIGRVMKLRRPLLVVDAPAEQSGAGRYRTGSFIAAPIMVGTAAIGAICATDKHDGSVFEERDCIALRLIAACAGSSLLYARTAAERDQLAQLESLDPVSGLHNRQYLDSRLQQEVDRTKREHTSVALMIADVDEFKHINDSAGHGPVLFERAWGEALAARELARARREQQQLSIVLFEVQPARTHTASDALAPVLDTFLKAARQSDLPIRWGARELLLILPGLPGPSARAVAERVRAAMHAGGRHTVLVAAGVVEADLSVRQFDDVVQRARARVALAVDRGHNRVH